MTLTGTRLARCLAVLTMAFVCDPAQAVNSEVTIAAASDLNFAFKAIIVSYEQQTGTRVRLSLGSSGNFFSQIQHGAPYDLYFSADIRYPQQLIESGHALEGSLYRYAVGRIVLWAQKGSKVEVSNGLGVLLDPAIKKIAIANPKHAPYGRAAMAALEHFKLSDLVRDRLVLGENISQAAQFVQSGAADAGIIALSLAVAPVMKDTGRYWEIPPDAYPALEQGAIILKSSKNQKEARAFMDFLRGKEARDIMKQFGFVLPDSDEARRER